ncbi:MULTISPECIES: ABC transporter ATP-binding protein [Pseudoalteromonas]|uniref:ABC-type antimicrobial peptide transport system, ATPase component n=1 Tax=Pseudoalteromonas luteoviolacea (strain 2ta16) TaxID=1353533 RepID=V4I123_PSEL2|nr:MULTISPECIES: ABC transporter ATP-binding protein [Pseudoalteromonas]ESP93919.1 ABC-type antimicrobial peptide transport system, ATPase component [Pseudoalteromonas luteoviolacea 2ta16]KZN31027.1 ABC transporter [Pseudoalteromonas luteoviolacea NCIMB 1944]MCG7548599.1 ABC transporter ATP-binding protein [Pseudoalteromonas sp. Of7M-16]
MNKDIKIEINHVSKVYDTDLVETHALKDINIKIYEGDYVSISGPSGGGKSTLLSIIGLLDEASGGELKIEGKDVTSLTQDQAAEVRNTKLGFIFQSFNLIEELSVYDNVALPLTYRTDGLAAEEIDKKVTECLEKVSLSHRLDHFPNQLSGGQQQRVAIARALAADPAILLVDEPTGNLDSTTGDQVMQLLEELNAQGTTICMVTHDSRYADMARTKYQLKDGVLQVEEEQLSEAV